MADEPPSDGDTRRNGKLSIPLPFDEALKAAMKVPADKLAKPSAKKPKATRTKRKA